MPYGLTVVAAPVVEPLSVDDVKAYCRVDDDDTSQDDVIENLISEMRERFERVTDRAVIRQTLKLTLDCWPCDGFIRMPRAPLVSVLTFKYVDVNTHALTTWDASNYRVDVGTLPGRVTLAWSKWPPNYLAETSALEITYVAGYGDAAAEDTEDAASDAADSVPPDMKGRIRTAVAYCYENRESRDETYIDRLFTPMAVCNEG